ncbi:MAG: response regulator [Hydrococcus sp. Prado102]|nr:response regulator [Hydrococcus sp. Prado102]
MTKILVIEDDNDLRNIIGEMLCAENFSVIEAEDGDIGVELAKEELPDLIICDIMLPSLDGYGVLYHLREVPSLQTVPFIFLSAKSTKADTRLGMELGADDYLTKPFTRDELLGAVTTRLIKQVAIERESQKKLDNLRESITYSLPHEFRTPLNSILNYSKLLIENYYDTEPEEALEMLKDIQHSGQLLFRLVQNFLLYGQLTQIAKDPQQLRKLLNSYEKSSTKTIIEEVALQRAILANRKADLQLELQEAILPISQSQLQKIAEELIDNAFKFSSKKTPVQIRSCFEDNTFQLFVIDRGRGMNAEQIANLGAYTQFERKVYAQQGSGLGLALVKLLTELHGGELKIESIPGQQTIVHAILPVN